MVTLEDTAASKLALKLFLAAQSTTARRIRAEGMEASATFACPYAMGFDKLLRHVMQHLSHILDP